MKWLVRGLFTVLAFGSVTGCSRQVPNSGSPNGPISGGQLPFDRVSDGTGVSPTAAFASNSIPPGTEITIRLQLILSSAEAHSGDTFRALLDQPIAIAGNTVVPRGTPVTGTVLAAAASDLNGPGYLRLGLASIAVNGKPLILQSSSLFAKGWSSEKAKARTANRSLAGDKDQPPFNNGDVRFSTGHRFTFRLIQPLHLQG